MAKKEPRTPEERSSGVGSLGAPPHRQVRDTPAKHNDAARGVKPLDLADFASLTPLSTRLIPLCRPNGTPGKCTDSTHRHDAASAGKVPIEKDWQKPGHHPHWPPKYNVGIRLGSTLGAIDVDPRNGGTETLRELEQRFGQLPPTPRSATGGSGWHYFYRVPADQASWKLSNGVELKANGSQVVAPGSLHHSGKKYEWVIPPDAAPLADLPEWLRTKPQSSVKPKLELVPEADPRSEWWRGDVLVFKDEEYTRAELSKRVTAYISAMPPSVTGKGGHDAAFRVACAIVRGYAFPSAQAMQLLQEWNETRAKPKWSKGELIHKLADAERSKAFAWGYLIRGDRDKYDDESTVSEENEENNKEVEEDPDLPAKRKFDPRLVYIVSMGKFAFFNEGIDKAPQARDQGIQFIEKDSAIAALTNEGVPYDAASRIARKKYCTIVEDTRRFPSNDRIIAQGVRKFLNPFWRLIPEPQKGNCPNIEALVKAIAGDEEGEKWLWNWAAYIIQDPNVLPGVAVVAKSAAKGIGKSKLGEMIGACRGVCVTVNPTVFRSDFTSKWADARFVLAAEVMLADSRQEDNQKFLGYITDPEIEYHRKNQPAYDIPNRIAWWLTSNLDNPVIVPKGDRRFTIFDSLSPGEEILGSLRGAWKRYESSWHEWDEIRAFKYRLLHYKVDERLARNPLLNLAHEEVEEASRSSPDAYADELRIQGWEHWSNHFGIDGVADTQDAEPGYAHVDPAFMYRVYQAWCREFGQATWGYIRFAHTHAMRSFSTTPQRRIKGVLYRLRKVPLRSQGT